LEFFDPCFVSSTNREVQRNQIFQQLIGLEKNIMTIFLSIQDVTKRFGDLVAVDHVSFEVNEGEIFGIAGPNGAGKTTLFNLITGIPFHADSGKVFFHGNSIEKLSPHNIYRLGIARTFQKETTFDTLTVEQNVHVGAFFGGIRDKHRSEEAVQLALQKLNLEADRRRIAGELPLFAKKRLMIASAIASNPKVLMLDEPGSGLNTIELTLLEHLIFELKKGGITIVIIEHVLTLLFGVSNRVMVMDFGRKLAEGLPEKLATDETVIEAYLGKHGKDAYHAVAG
jgi:branched-chain amino acid transport system ATP-binding protein